MSYELKEGKYYDDIAYDEHFQEIMNINILDYQANSTASDVSGLVADFNALLAKLKASKIMKENS